MFLDLILYSILTTTEAPVYPQGSQFETDLTLKKTNVAFTPA